MILRPFAHRSLRDLPAHDPTTPRSRGRAWAEVDLDAVRHNVRTIRDHAGVALMAVVKADAYGLGAPDVSRAALDAGASYLGVATPHEALTLRHAGINAPIQILGSLLDDEVDVALQARTTLTLHSLSDLHRVAHAARRLGRRPAVHVMVDVGMARHGISPSQALDLLRSASKERAVRLDGFMTHLPCASDPDLARTRAQVAAFAGLTRRAAAQGHLPPRVHAAASAGLFRLPEARFTQVRAGIALGGVDPGGLRAAGADLRPALSVHTKITHLRKVPKGSSVGYGGRWTAPRPSRLAVLGVGYGDGVLYSLTGHDAHVLIQGRPCPLVGTVMMDYLLADVTHLPSLPKRGDVATLIGSQRQRSIPLEEQAERAGVIPYALSCSLGSSLPRASTHAQSARHAA